MVDYDTEEEQLEAIKRWWRENGVGVILGVVVGLGALAGWKGWTWYQNEQAMAASAIYDEVTTALDAARDAGISNIQIGKARVTAR